MVRRAFVQRSLVEVLLPDGDKLWDPTLRAIDDVLTDDELVDQVVEALGRRHPQSRRRGRLGTPAEVVLLSFAKTPSGGQVVDLSAPIGRQSRFMISTLLHLPRLCPFLCGGHRQLALENLALPQQLAGI